MIKILKDHRSIVLADQGVVSGTNFITGILLARMLGPSDFGIYAFVWLVLMILLSFQYTLFIQPMQILFHSENRESEGRYSSSIYYAALGWIFGITIVFGVFLNFSSVINHNSVLILSSAFTFIFVCLQDFLRRSFIIRGQITEALKTDIISVVPQLAIVIVIFLFPVSVSWAVFLVGLTYVAPVVYGTFKYAPGKISLKNVRAYFTNHFNQAKWLLSTCVLQVFTGNYFLLQAPIFLGVAALGAIRLAQNLIGVLNVLLQAFDNYVPSSAAKLLAAGKNFKQYLLRISLQTGIAFGILLAFVFIFSKPIFAMAGGNSYAGYGYALQGFCIIYIVMFATYPIRILLRLKELSHQIFIAYIIAAVFSILSSRFLIQHYEIYGVLYGMLIVQIIMLTYMGISASLKTTRYAHYTLYTRKG